MHNLVSNDHKRSYLTYNLDGESMYFEEENTKLLEMLQSNESISTVELTKIFDVSEITIRRDLTKLESLGLVQRVHGGVIGTSIENKMELSFFQKCNLNLERKNASGKKRLNWFPLAIQSCWTPEQPPFKSPNRLRTEWGSM